MGSRFCLRIIFSQKDLNTKSLATINLYFFKVKVNMNEMPTEYLNDSTNYTENEVGVINILKTPLNCN